MTILTMPNPVEPLTIGHLGLGEDAAAWDEYLADRTTTVTALSAWRRIVHQAYGIEAHFLVARCAEQIVGSLGLYEIRHPLFGHYLTTAPFGTDGGFYFDSENARDLLIAEARRIAAAGRVDYLLIRTRDVALEGFQDNQQYCTSLLSLAEGPEAVWKGLPAKTRNQVRRGQKEGFTVSAGVDQIGAFHDVFHQHMRDLGSPGHSRQFYEAIAEHLGSLAEYLVVRDGAQLVAGALVFRVNGTAANHHTIALRRFNKRCPNYLLYWTMIESACQRECTSFDMGRSRRDTSNLQFKSNWNPEDIPLHYNYQLHRAEEVPDLDPRNPSFRMKIAVWQKLPLFLTRRVGPLLIPGLA